MLRVASSNHQRHRRKRGLEGGSVDPKACRRAREGIIRGLHHRGAFSVTVVLKAHVSDGEDPREKVEHFRLPREE